MYVRLINTEGAIILPTLNSEPIAKAEMLIRKPVAEVFEAFLNPAITSRFWFTKSSGRLEAGKRVQWEWEMYGAVADVDVLEIEETTESSSTLVPRSSGFLHLWLRTKRLSRLQTQGFKEMRMPS